MITQTLGALIEALGWTLIHFVWQGALIGLLFAAGGGLMKRNNAGGRYHLGLACLALCAVLPAITFVEVLEMPMASAPMSVAVAVQAPVLALTESADWWAQAQMILEVALPWLVLGWFVGVSILSVRLVSGWNKMHMMCREGVRDLSPYWLARCDELRRMIEVSGAVRFLESTLVHVPTVVGWLKPVVLLPSSSLIGLSPRQLELIIAHELGHVRRNDYLINLIQVWIETLLFFHPVVRWVSHRIRVERENCCDDLVLDRLGDAVHYAKALTNLEAMRGGELLAPAATGGILTERIERIIDPGHTCPHSSKSSGGIPFFGMILGAVLLSQWTIPPQVSAIPHALPGNVSAADSQNNGWQFSIPFFESVRRELASESVVGAAASQSVGASSQSTQGEQSSAPMASSSLQLIDQVIANSTAFAPERIAPELNMNLETVVARATPELTLPAPGELYDASTVVPSAENALPGLVATQSAAPDYPRRAMLRSIEGYARVEFTVTAQGRVIDAVVVDASPERVFDRAALEAIRQWRFDPASVSVVDGRRASQEFQFNLGLNGEGDRKSCTPITGTRICRGARTALDLKTLSRDRIEGRPNQRLPQPL